MPSFDSGEPFGLPRGTVRGVIALTFTALIAHAFLTGTITAELLAVGGPYLGFYFGTRPNEVPSPTRTEEPLGDPAIGVGD